MADAGPEERKHIEILQKINRELNTWTNALEVHTKAINWHYKDQAAGVAVDPAFTRATQVLISDVEKQIKKLTTLKERLENNLQPKAEDRPRPKM